MFYDVFSQLQECIENVKLSLNGISDTTDSAKRLILEGLDVFSKTLQENMKSHYEAILSTLTSQSQALQEMEKRDIQINSETNGLKSCVFALQDKLESMKTEQNNDYGKICEKLDLLTDSLKFTEILTLLDKVASSYRPSPKVTDCTVQTSPGLYEKICLVSEEKTYFESMRVCRPNSMQPNGSLALEKMGDEGSAPNKEPEERYDHDLSGKVNLVSSSKKEQTSIIYDEVSLNHKIDAFKDGSSESPSHTLYHTHSATTSVFTDAQSGLLNAQADSSQPVALQEKKSNSQACSSLQSQAQNNLHDYRLTKCSQSFKGKGKRVANYPGVGRICKTDQGLKKCKKGFKKRYKTCPAKKNNKVNKLKFSENQTESIQPTCNDDQIFQNDSHIRKDVFENGLGNVRASAEIHQYQTSDPQDKENKFMPISYSCKSVIKTSDNAGSCLMGPTKATNVQMNLWDCSSQDNGHTQYITGYKKKTLSWMSPFSPGVHRPTFSVVSAPKAQEIKKYKMLSHFSVFDTSDDSD
ncbi:interactor of HORMAD1 protein 1 [Amia ocellicauda]|uniref:interactor of HORMAD1 protein 1 n=1 Tax=Amia ocellicauda TaxID=2972642 RepID=UPI0034638BCF